MWTYRCRTCGICLCHSQDQDLAASVASLSRQYCSAERELLKLSIKFNPLWERTFKIVLDSVAALDNTRADAQKLLRGHQTDDNARKLHRFNQESEERLQDLEDALRDLLSVIADMKECAVSTGNSDSRRDISRESPASRPARVKESMW
jgi:hypothetical protein